MTKRLIHAVFSFCCLTAVLGLESTGADEQDRLVASSGFRAWIGDDESTARLSIKRLGRFEVALNVDPDLAYFSHIVPCGLQGVTVTSMARELGDPPEMGRVMDSITAAFGRTFNIETRQPQAEGVLVG